MFKTVDQKIKMSRLTTCRSCDKFISKLNTCKVCKCYLPAKTMFAEAECPENKWTQHIASTSMISLIEESILKIWNEQK